MTEPCRMFALEECTCPWCEFSRRPIASRVSRMFDWLVVQVMNLEERMDRASRRLSPPPPCRFDPPPPSEHIVVGLCTAQFEPMCCEGQADHLPSAERTATVALWKAEQPED